MLDMRQGSGPGTSMRLPGQGEIRPMFSSLPVRLVALVGALLMFGGGAALWFTAADGRAGATTARLPRPALPAAPAGAEEPLLAPPPPAEPKSREEQRFARADKDDDGRITQAEYLAARRRNFDKLDTNNDGKLAFDEYAASGLAKFQKADSDGNGALVAAEFATTAPTRKNRQTASVEQCRCPPDQMARSSDEPSQD